MTSVPSRADSQITPLCDSCHQDSKGETIYYHAVSRSMVQGESTNCHNLWAGDLIIYSDGETGFSLKKEFCKGNVSLGQVLVFEETFSSDYASTIIRCQVHKLLHYEQVKPSSKHKSHYKNLTKQQDKDLNDRKRKNFAIFETHQVATISVASILPARITLLHGFEAKELFDATPSPQHDGMWEFKFHCPGHLDNYTDDWRGYSIAPGLPPPLPLVRGWKNCIADPTLYEAITNKFQSCLFQCTVQDRTSDTNSTEQQEQPTKKAAAAAVSTKSKRKASPPVAAASNPKEKRHRAADTAPIAADTANETASMAADTVNETAPTAAVANETALTAAALDEENEEPVKLLVDPLTPAPMFTLTGQLRGDPSKPDLHFYHGVQLSTNFASIDPSFAPTLAPTWSVCVGDLIAVSCDDGVAEFPFVQPWSAAQIVSVYRVGTNAAYFMEVRWLYRPRDLKASVLDNLTEDVRKQLLTGKFANRMVVEVDEHVTEAPIEAALGRVVTSSRDKEPPKWFKSFVSNDKVVQIPLLCQYMYLMEFDETNLTRTHDWTNYGSTLAGPLNRALLCEKGWAGRKFSKFLRKKYRVYFVERYGIDSTEMMVKSDAPLVNTAKPVDRLLSWPSELLHAKVIAKPKDVIHQADISAGKKREFLQSILVPVVRRRCSESRATASKAAAQDVFWKVSVGDFVCMINEKAVPKISSAGQQNPWYPFVGPWSVCQVLCMYRDVSSRSRTDKDTPMAPVLEVRWFYNETDMPEHLRSWMPLPMDLKMDCIFETDVVVSEIPASKIIGRVELFMGHHIDSSTPKPESTETEVPSVAFRCRFMYRAAVDRFQPHFCADKTPGRWFRWMLERGFKTSALVQNDKRLSQKMEKFTSVQDDLFEEIFDSSGTKLVYEQPKALSLARSIKDDIVAYFITIPMEPRWNDFAFSEDVCTGRDRKSLYWILRVGDVVAASCENSSGKSTFPFTVPWSPCQVLSIFSNSDGRQQAEVRWLSRKVPDQLAALSTPRDTSLECCVDSKHAEPVIIDASIILSPVTLLHERIRRSVWTGIPTFLPAAPLRYEGSEVKDGFTTATNTEIDKMLSTICIRGVEFSSLIHPDDKQIIIKAIEKECYEAKATSNRFYLPLVSQLGGEENDPKFVPSATSRSDRSLSSPILSRTVASTSAHNLSPFHVDVSAGLEFYDCLVVVPSSNAYAPEYRQIMQTPQSVWKVKLGDTVVLHYESGGRMQKKSVCAPMCVPFGIGEIISIFKQTEMLDDDSALSCEGLRLEIRWFYRAREIPGFKERKNIDLKYEEIFESDHVDEISASSILAPAALIANNSSPDITICDGLQQLNFLCHRFWSFHRRAFLPSGSFEKRMERGRLYSIYFKDAALRESLNRRTAPMSANITNSTQEQSDVVSHDSPISALKSVIEKMTLSDASIANQQSSELIGREKERETISTFLRAAIAGNMMDQCSIFIAGPPGTGKTACVRAIVADLQREQSTGAVASFKFVTLNGMELPTPADAYTRLLEQVSRDKTSLAPDKAAKALEQIFTGESSESQGTTKTTTFVLLVDELDYLVTRKETLMYNLFHWPRRALEIQSPNRLVVVGISNTLNLPESLHTRVQSRIGTSRCSFPSYTASEIASILNAKVKKAAPNCTVFAKDAIEFASKKTARSGDIRRALRVCRDAAELVLEEYECWDGTGERPSLVVTIQDVNLCAQDPLKAGLSLAVQHASVFEALLLAALAHLGLRTGRDSAGFDVEEIVFKMEAMAAALGDKQYLPPPCLAETLDMISRLAEAHIISCKTPRNASLSYRSHISGSGGPWPLITLGMADADVGVALSKSVFHKELARKYFG